VNTMQAHPAFIAQGYALVGEAQSFDPQTGARYEQFFEGTQNGILALANILSSAGAIIRYEIAGPGKKRLAALWGTPYGVAPEDEVPTERWDLAMEPVEISIWRVQKVIAEQNAYSDPNAYRKLIEDAAAAGAAFPLTPAASYPAGVQAHRLLLWDASAFKTQLPTLRMNRSFTVGYPTRMQIKVTDDVYTTGRLISDFSVPLAVQSQLPTNPVVTPPPGTVYGWRWSQQASGYTVSTRRWEENLGWEFNAWHSALYTIIS